jgi:hypothetical protein
MNRQVKREYLKRVQERYRKGTREDKGRILDEMTLVLGCTRKWAIKLLAAEIPSPQPGKGRRRQYPAEILTPILYELWTRMNRVHARRLKAALPLWIDHFHDPRITPEVKEWLLAMSAATMDRLLRHGRHKRGICGTRPSKRFLKSIPIQPKDWNITKPGTIQQDTVAHTTSSLEGDFANTLTATDIHTAWTENRALWNKSHRNMIAALSEIEDAFPFAFETAKSDSGSEFMNWAVVGYYQRRPKPVQVVRGRPYRKNDNCYVEQKNFTHVRELFGYEKIDRPELVDWMNRIYRDLWNPLHNFFLPSQKLLRKTRIGSQIKKEYDEPKTPCERVLESQGVTEEQKENLRTRLQALNPVELSRELEEELKAFQATLRSIRKWAA